MSHLTPIKVLSGNTFHVKDYQRGYRWRQQDVRRLLDDLLDFQSRLTGGSGHLYCLQPIVVKQDLSDKHYELIDGQQRLTTLLIALTSMNTAKANCPVCPYSIQYQTRQESSGNFLQSDFYSSVVVGKTWEEYVEEQTSVEKGLDKIDHFYFYHASSAVLDWMQEHCSLDFNAFGKMILEAVAVIWYMPEPKEDAREIFRRLNVGKIPLTTSELLKAAFLHNHPERAQKWNAMEHALL